MTKGIRTILKRWTWEEIFLTIFLKTVHLFISCQLSSGGEYAMDRTTLGAQQWKIHLRCRNHRRQCSVPGLGRFPGEHGNPLQYSCLENSVDRGAWWVAKSWTRLKQLSTHACYGENWDLRHGASVCMSCVPTCNVCMLVCVSKNVLIWIVIGWVLNINFELIVHLICIYIMFFLISPFYFSEEPQEKNGKICKNLLLTDCSHVIDFLSPWDSHALNLYTFPCLFFSLCLYLSLPNF